MKTKLLVLLPLICWCFNISAQKQEKENVQSGWDLSILESQKKYWNTVDNDLLLSSGKVKTWSELNKGDWFVLEYSFFISKEGKPTVDLNVIERQIEYKVSVLNKTRDLLSMSVKPVHVYVNRVDSGHWLPAAIYFDSYYIADFYSLDKEKQLQFGQQDSLIISIDLKTGLIKEAVGYIAQEKWSFPAKILESGIKKSLETRNSSAYLQMEIDTKQAFSDILSYFYRWSKQAHLSWLMENSRGMLDVFQQMKLKKSSFEMTPNVQIIYKASQPVLKHGLLVQIQNQSHVLNPKGDNSIEFSCFISDPERVYFVGHELLVSPGDSIYITPGMDDKPVYSGEGAANCQFAYEFSHLHSKLSKDSFFFNPPTTDQVLGILAKSDSVFQFLWKKQESRMSPYWVHSYKLAQKYYYMAVCIDAHLNMKEYPFAVPWNDMIFSSVFPFMDYVYHPSYYEEFMQNYCSYKQSQLNDDVISGAKWYWGDNMATYYLYRQLLAGYPRFLQTANCLKSLMNDYPLPYSQREYQDFVTSCKAPILLNQIKQLHDGLERIEPGKNIKDLHLGIEKSLSLKKKFDGYIVLDLSPSADDNFKINQEDIQLFQDKLKDADSAIKEKLKLVCVRNVNYQKQLSSEQQQGPIYVFMNEKDIENDRQIISPDLSHMHMNSILLIRNDGTIVSRDIWKIWCLNKDVDALYSLIKEDMSKPQKAEKADGTIVIIVSIIAGLIGAIFAVRSQVIRKRERMKRFIAELELKAIRSQMNPHFIFNALSSIQYLINQGKNKEANRYLLDFSKLLRMVLASSEKKLISLSEEIEQLELYLHLEQLRLPFHYQIETDQAIHPEEEEIPGMLIQPLVENAVNHGMAPHKGGNIEIRFCKKDTALCVEVKDDGPGFPGPSQHSGGFGLKAIEERLRLLNKEYKSDIGITIENVEPHGAKIVISIPL